ncbi:MAG: hypothetical protein RSD28_04845 [Lachnospiraceae bacterium]
MKKKISGLLVLLFGFGLISMANDSIENVKIKKPETELNIEVKAAKTIELEQQTEKIAIRSVPPLEKTELEQQKRLPAKLQVGLGEWLGQVVPQEERALLIQGFTLEEEEVYTFLQGPKSWERSVPWSGEWCTFGVRGNSFGNFGCGLCCMANIYDTLSPYEVSPWDMCEYAMEASGYAPSGKSGAIDWGNIKVTLSSCGMNCDVYFKPDTYEAFQNQIANVKSAIVLVCSSNDNTYWKKTPGHYVNIWLYQKESDTVFLAEPGSPENNRSRIPLRYIYDALKTSSQYQYLAVAEYKEQDNTWKSNCMTGAWNRP